MLTQIDKDAVLDLIKSETSGPKGIKLILTELHKYFIGRYSKSDLLKYVRELENARAIYACTCGDCECDIMIARTVSGNLTKMGKIELRAEATRSS